VTAIDVPNVDDYCEETRFMTTTHNRSHMWLAALAGAAALVVAACSSPAAPTPAASDTVQAPTIAAPSEAATVAAPTESAGGTAASASTEYPVTIAQYSHGSYLAGEDGKTLYTFKSDTANSGTSACTGDCATMWPPWTLGPNEKAVAGAGVLGALATFARADGKMQVTYNGVPLYYYSGDKKAGDTNGYGVDKMWFVAVP
jgi:predicted lipoprotein with Yx(FWY)xxD motif